MPNAKLATKVGFENAIPILNVKRLDASIAFYRDVLGFAAKWQTPRMAGVGRDGANIMLCEGDQGQPGTWVWIGAEDIEPLYEVCVAKGAKIRQKPTNSPWAYEMKIEDPDGHVLRIGSEPKPDRSSA